MRQGCARGMSGLSQSTGLSFPKPAPLFSQHQPRYWTSHSRTRWMKTPMKLSASLCRHQLAWQMQSWFGGKFTFCRRSWIRNDPCSIPLKPGPRTGRTTGCRLPRNNEHTHHNVRMTVSAHPTGGLPAGCARGLLPGPRGGLGSEARRTARVVRLWCIASSRPR